MGKSAAPLSPDTAKTYRVSWVIPDVLFLSVILFFFTFCYIYIYKEYFVQFDRWLRCLVDSVLTDSLRLTWILFTNKPAVMLAQRQTQRGWIDLYFAAFSGWLIRICYWPRKSRIDRFTVSGPDDVWNAIRVYDGQPNRNAMSAQSKDILIKLQLVSTPMKERESTHTKGSYVTRLAPLYSTNKVSTHQKDGCRGISEKIFCTTWNIHQSKKSINRSLKMLSPEVFENE